MSPKPVSLSSQEWVERLGVNPPATWPRLLTGVQPDSRRVRSGDVFVAIEGHEADGHRFISDAVRRGASGIVAGHPLSTQVKVPVVIVSDPRATLASLARCLFHFPDKELRLTGVTGTNGKTSVVGFAYQLLQAQGIECGQLGTVSYRFGQREIPARRTTPGAPDLHEYLRSMVDANCTDCVMEVSSHALDQKRVAGLNFTTAVFSNLSQDHLDYHSDMEQYFQTKAQLFRMEGLRHRIVGEDRWSQRLAKEFGSGVLRCGFSDDCEIQAKIVSSTLEGTQAHVTSPWGEGTLKIRQPGEHNLRNVLQALAVAAGYGLSFTDLLKQANSLISAPGRLESIESKCGKVLVDYAHTPDALTNVLTLLKPLTKGKLKIVFGCGGDRDRSKRPLMAQAASFADELILTTDNPRTEDPMQILDDMKVGLGPTDSYRIIEDRRSAIEAGIFSLTSDDILLIAGKGHETVQLLGALQVPFDDRIVAGEVLAKRELSKRGSC